MHPGLLALTLLSACGEPDLPPPPDPSATTDSPNDTATDTAPPDSAPPDTAPLDSAGETASPTGDTAPSDTAPPDADADGWPAPDDCDDSRADVHPGRPEICGDAADNDCDPGTGDALAADYTGAASLGDAAATFYGQAAGHRAGEAIAFVGDLDGDGMDELAIGAPVAGWGTVYLAYGGDPGVSLGELETAIVGSADSFGTALLGPGDLDGDGYDELVIHGGGAGHRGGVFLWRGGAERLGGADTGALVTLTGAVDNEDFGHGLAAADVDGDRRPELALAALEAREPGTLAYPGRIYLLRDPLAASSVDDAAVVIEPTGADDQMGKIAGAGDMDGDGLEELLIGARGVGDEAGVAHLFAGASLAAGGVFSRGDADATWLGVHQGDGAGATVRGAGDVEGDGLADALVAAPYIDDEHAERGAVYLITGLAAGEHSLADAHARVAGLAASDKLGTEAVGGGNLNGDCADDLLLGAHDADTGAWQSGAAYLFLGPVSGALTAGDADATFAGEAEWQWVGWALAAGGDFNGDGVGDFATSSFRDDSAGEDAGATWLFYGGAP